MEEVIKEGGLAFLDGGLATELETRGADLTGALWSARLINENPGLIRDTHLSYYIAGADVGISASYQATIQGFQKIGFDAREGEDLLKRSVTLLKEARDQAWLTISSGSSGGRARPSVAASIGSYGAFLADGSEYSGNYGISVEEIKEFHRRRMLTLLSAAPDLLACETIPCLAEVQALLELLAEPSVASTGVKAWISVSLRDHEHLSSGESLEAVMEAIESLRGASLFAFGINCSAPRHVEGALRKISRKTNLPLIVYANKGEEWDGINKVWIPGTAVTDEQYCQMAVLWRAAGASAIGGCCRTSPATISLLRATLCSPSLP